LPSPNGGENELGGEVAGGFSFLLASERARQAFDAQKRQEESDRKQRAIQEERETKAQDARRESAYRQSKAAHRAKVKKIRKNAGLKPHNSWQLK